MNVRMLYWEIIYHLFVDNMITYYLENNNEVMM